MKTKILFFLIFLSFPFSLFSQWGGKAGLDYGTLTGTDLSKYRLGFHIGATYDFKLNDKFYLQPALLFSLNSVGLQQGVNGKDGKVDKYYLEVPVNLSFRPKISNNNKFVFDFGLYTKYGLFGNTEYETDEGKIIESTYNIYNRFDAGINIGTGIEIKRLYIGLAYQLGFVHADKQLSSLNNQIFRASLGYKF